MSFIPCVTNHVTVEPIMCTGARLILPNHVATVAIDSEGESCPIGVVSDSYRVTQMCDVIEHVEAALVNSLQYDLYRRITTTDHVTYNNGYVDRRWRIPLKDKALAKVGESVAAELRVSTSYDGRTPTIARAGLLDLVCTNGMVMARDETVVRRRHSGTFDYNKLRGFVIQLRTCVQEYLGRVVAWKGTDLPSMSTIADMLIAHGLSRRLVADLVDRVQVESEERDDRSMYALVSALTYWSSHANDNDFTKVRTNAAGNIEYLLSKREESVRRFLDDAPFQELIAA